MLNKSKTDREGVNVKFNTDKPYKFNYMNINTLGIPDKKLYLKLATYLDIRLKQYYDENKIPPTRLLFYIVYKNTSYTGTLERVYDCTTKTTISISRQYLITKLVEG